MSEYDWPTIDRHRRRERTIDDDWEDWRDGIVEHDMVNEPPHYRWLPMGIEAIDITELFNFNLGNALKYVLRSKHKGREIEDLKKARWYIDREIKRIEKEMQ